ncbi:hypothetical protein KIPB_014046 [Kipferlia bialata]|uniref:Uncharacterized protein n=1 Tax=Kipferlia bialata TaxID=797122 RepID=A0A9K3D9S8_9EUKA|nr:hypothetical protein KIPB_014046 [Kipferlia bialata]|eukprot:g14046.t1
MYSDPFSGFCHTIIGVQIVCSGDGRSLLDFKTPGDIDPRTLLSDVVDGIDARVQTGEESAPDSDRDPTERDGGCDEVGVPSCPL